MKSIKLSFFTLYFLSVVACTKENPQQIIDKTIATAGGDSYLHSTIEFDFRGRHYKAIRNGSTFSYERVFKNDKDSTQIIHDRVSNDGFTRTVNNSIMQLPDSMKAKYTSSTNSVLYFALLPYGLNDASVRKKIIGKTDLEGKSYYKIEITFAQEGGGEDFEDTFHYWIDTQDFTIGYLAYSFEENGVPDCRFRKAINPRMQNGIRFSDYINYSPPKNTLLDELENLYKKDLLKELSKIESENIVVKIN
jgi:hypothetical protein